MNSSLLTNGALLASRVLISLMFISSGFSKIGGYAGTVGYMEKVGVPGALLPLVILTELGCGLLVFAGFQTRIAAFLLAGFCLVSAYIFHYQPADLMQMINFWKNISIAGGFLALVGAGAGAWSIDGLRGRMQGSLQMA